MPGPSCASASPATATADHIGHGRQRVVREGPVDPALTVAGPDDRQVDGQEDSGETEIDRLLDQLVGDPVIAEDVDLEERTPPGAAAATSAALARREGREAHRAPAAAAARAIPSSPSGCAVSLVGDGRDDDGLSLAGGPSTVVAGRHRVDAAEDASRAPRGEGGHIAGERPLASGAPEQERGGVGVEPRDRKRLDVGQRQRRLHHTRLTPYSG